MPGPYINSAAVQAYVLTQLGQDPSSTLPLHWVNACSRAVTRGYQRLIMILVGRGYSISQIDSWSGRITYNTDYACAYAFGYGNQRKGEDDNNSEQKELARIDKELKDPASILTDDSGSVITPDLVVGPNQVSSGRMTQFDTDAANFEAWQDGFIVDQSSTTFEEDPLWRNR